MAPRNNTCHIYIYILWTKNVRGWEYVYSAGFFACGHSLARIDWRMLPSSCLSHFSSLLVSVPVFPHFLLYLFLIHSIGWISLLLSYRSRCTMCFKFWCGSYCLPGSIFVLLFIALDEINAFERCSQLACLFLFVKSPVGVGASECGERPVRTGTDGTPACGVWLSDWAPVFFSIHWKTRSAAGFLDTYLLVVRLYAGRLQSNQHYTRGRTVTRRDTIIM